jgi:hypothetical protein
MQIIRNGKDTPSSTWGAYVGDEEYAAAPAGTGAQEARS